MCSTYKEVVVSQVCKPTGTRCLFFVSQVLPLYRGVNRDIEYIRCIVMDIYVVWDRMRPANRQDG